MLIYFETEPELAEAANWLTVRRTDHKKSSYNEGRLAKDISWGTISKARESTSELKPYYYKGKIYWRINEYRL